jgi:hypothetical protein
VIAYKFLAEGRIGMFSGFRWPVGEWVAAELDPCRTGVHACRVYDLPYWLGDTLYEIELDGRTTAGGMKVVAERGRLLRRIDAWGSAAQAGYVAMCLARAAEIAASAPEPLESWAPKAGSADVRPSLAGYIAARIAEESGGIDAYIDERVRQSDWLARRLGLVGD